MLVNMGPFHLGCNRFFSMAGKDQKGLAKATVHTETNKPISRNSSTENAVQYFVFNSHLKDSVN